MKNELMMHEFRADPRPRPLSVTAALLGLVIASAILLVRFGGAFVAVGSNTGWKPIPLSIVAVSAMIAVAVPLVAAWLLRRGGAGGAVLATIVGLWGLSEFFTYGDPLAIVTGLTSATTVVAVWTQSARAWARSVRHARREARGFSGK